MKIKEQYVFQNEKHLSSDLPVYLISYIIVYRIISRQNKSKQRIPKHKHSKLMFISSLIHLVCHRHHPSDLLLHFYVVHIFTKNSLL